jgi:endonuclease YncB( thermonuclease family)
MKITGKKKLVGTFLIVGTLAICLILVLNRGGTPKVDHYEVIDGDTIKAQFSDGSSILIRYAAVNTPARSQTLGTTAWEFNEGLIQSAQATGNLIVDLKPSDDGNNGEDRDDRLLAHVFVGGERSAENNVEVRLVAKGYARLDVRNPNDKNIANGQDFDVRYAEDLIAAQIEAAMARRGWWGEDDEYADSDLIIAAIKQWSDDEIVYIINRGSEPVNLAAEWKLIDASGSKRNTLVFSDYLTDECLLPPGGLLRIHSASIATGRKGEHTPCGESEIDFYWTGYYIWDQEGDIGTLYGPNSEGVVYSYTYPLTTDYWK